jgi:hypothetical protein
MAESQSNYYLNMAESHSSWRSNHLLRKCNLGTNCRDINLIDKCGLIQCTNSWNTDAQGGKVGRSCCIYVMSPKCCQNEILSSIVCSNCISEESDEEKESEKDRLLELESELDSNASQWVKSTIPATTYLLLKIAPDVLTGQYSKYISSMSTYMLSVSESLLSSTVYAGPE